MELAGRRVLICNCETTMPLDGKRLGKACQAAGANGEVDLNSQLCRAQLGNFQQALEAGTPLLVACTQEAPLFTEVATEAESEAELGFINIRENAGWSHEADRPDALAKMAALVRLATEEAKPTPSITLKSEGICLVYGRDEVAIQAAKQLAGRLDVTVLLTEAEDVIPPGVMDVPIFKGKITQAKGHLGAFGINVGGYAPATPAARALLSFEAPRDNAFTECDLILDLTGGTPLFPSHERRDGYMRPDPGDPAAVQKALFDIVDLVGEFEKPRYVAYDQSICAHSRSRKTGCTRCIDLCPTSAITPNGDYVAIDAHVCGGCGLCASACPTGAITYELPAGDSLFQALRSYLRAYGDAGGKRPLLLLHDERHGRQMIDLMARLGRGLPGRVLPFALNEVTEIGIDFLATALAYGCEAVAILVGPEKSDEVTGLAQQIGLAETVMEGLGYGAGRVHLLDERDPDKVEAFLWSLETKAAAPAGSFLPMGGKRTRTMLAFGHLHDEAPQPVDHLPLPQGAPFGRIRIDTEGCTLCLACIGACPTGALLDDPERPWVGFREEACVQCGLCKNTCPEKVITLEPRLNFTAEAKEAIELNRAEPFNCVRCGKPFGVERSIMHIAEQLAGKHSMFLEAARIERIMMCDDCRIITEFEKEDAPLRGAMRPLPRTTDDYLREREMEKAREMAAKAGVTVGKKKNGKDETKH